MNTADTYTVACPVCAADLTVQVREFTQGVPPYTQNRTGAEIIDGCTCPFTQEQENFILWKARQQHASG